MKFQKESNRMSAVWRMLKGLALAWITALIICAISAVMLASGTLSEEMMTYTALLALLLSALLGSLLAIGKEGTERLLWGSVFGIVYWTSLFCFGILLFEEATSGLAVTGLVIMGGSLTASLLKMPSKGGGRYGKFKYKRGAFVQN